ncbi:MULTISPECIES: hypothetical protein [Paenibacillus]|uniref:hypothetical protein n=1 Tax=Paenibacillus TaxID=44249 RepID=UPI00096D8AC1|nr:hypothetical protein [Paenibacillus odorifer]OME12777.1 hypothetical protein BSK60_16880 [Paenibacillus odorifer]
MTNQYPWSSNTTPPIASQDDPRYETPGGAQHKVDTHVNVTGNIADKAVTQPKIADWAVGARQINPSLLEHYGDIATNAKFEVIDEQLADIQIDVRSFGVVGNCNYYDSVTAKWYVDSGFSVEATDDTIAMQAAFDYVISHNKNLYIPKGNYLISSTLLISYTSANTFEIFGENSNQTCFIGKISTNIPLIRVYDPVVADLGLKNKLINIYIKPYNTTYYYTFTAFLYDSTIGFETIGCYAERCKTGFMLTDTGGRYTELNIFDNCYSAACDYNFRFEGSLTTTSFHGNKFINCGFTARNMESSKGYGRDFLQHGLSLEKGYVYNCEFNFLVFIENGGCLFYINSGGIWNFANISYENNPAPGYANVAAKIVTGSNASAHLWLKGDVIASGSVYGAIDWSLYTKSANNTEKFLCDNLSRTFRAVNTEHSGKTFEVRTIDTDDDDQRDSGVNPGLYRSTSTDFTDFSLMLLTKGNTDRVVIAKTAINGSAESAVMGFELLSDGTRINSKLGSTITFESDAISTPQSFKTSGIHNGSHHIIGGIHLWEDQVSHKLRVNFGVPPFNSSGNYLSTFVAVPASATATGNPGEWSSDANFMYVCHATNTWKRVAIATW